MFHRERVRYGLFGVDSGVMTVDRGHDLLDWNVISTKPEGALKGPTCGMHWPNLLHENPERNHEIVDSWVKLLRPYDDRPDTILAENSILFQKQLIHYKLTRVSVKERSIDLDFSKTDELQTVLPRDELRVKILSRKELRFSSHTVRVAGVEVKKREGAFLYTLKLVRAAGTRASVTFKAVAGV